MRYRSILAYCLAVVVAGVLVTSCGSVYTSPDFDVDTVDHKQVAILPFEVAINPENMSKDLSQDDLEELETKQGESFQKALYSRYLQRQRYGGYTVQFQDISATNILLTRNTTAKDAKEALSTLTKAEICKALNVDAVISGEIFLSKPLGTAAALASMVLFDIPASTNEAHMNLSIHERDNGNLLWNFERSLDGSLYSTPDAVARYLISSAANYFPYRK